MIVAGCVNVARQKTAGSLIYQCWGLEVESKGKETEESALQRERKPM